MLKSFEHWLRIVEGKAVPMKSPENLDLTKSIGTLKNGKKVYPNCDNTNHSSFDHEEWDEAANILREFIYDHFISPNMRKGVSPSKDQEKRIIGLTEIRKELEKMKDKSTELYNSSDQKIKDDARAKKSADFEKQLNADNIKKKKEAISKLEGEDKTLYFNLKNSLDRLKSNHSGDSVSFGVSVAERRRELKNKMDKILKKYL